MRVYVILISFIIMSFASDHKSIYDYTVKDINGVDFSFSTLKGKKFMVVNVASKCHYTPQYEGLEVLYKQYHSAGFEIIGFPANNFLWQEPGTDADIKQFCRVNYQVTFPIMSKISVKGKSKAPIYKWLTQKDLNGKMSSNVKWNFQKYLIDEKGALVAVLPPSTLPNDPRIQKWIETGVFE